jgi:DNA invertase Pin-like site-specific DNA recombinase
MRVLLGEGWLSATVCRNRSAPVIVGYARVSTERSEQDISIAEQVQQLKAAGCDRVIAERRSAHKEIARPGWDELLALVAGGRVRRVVAISLSRLSRKGEDVPFLRMCARLRVEVQLLDGTPADTADPSGKLLTGVLSLVNEIDSDIKGINTRNGLARRKAAGHYACGRVPFGYAYDGSQVVPHPERFTQAREIWEQLAAMEFNVPGTIRRHGLQWSARGLARWLNNPILRGVVNHQPDRVAALISWAEWQQARRLMESRTISGTRAPRVIKAFSGLVRCSGCEKAMHYAAAHGKPRFKCTNLLCPLWGRGLAEWKVQAQVLEELRGAADRMATIAAAPTTAEPSPTDHAKRQQVEQLEALAAQGVPGLAPTIEALRLELLAPPPLVSANWAGYRELLARPGVLEAATVEELRAVVLELVEQVRYIGDPNRVEIRLRGGPSGDAA